MWELDHKEGWVCKNWCFWTVVLEKTLESLLGCKRSNQSILREISPEYSLEGLMLKLRLQYFGHLMQRIGSLEKTLMLGKTEGRRRGDDREWDCWMASLTRWTWVWANSGRWWRTGKPGVLQSMGTQRVGRDWVTEQQQGSDNIFIGPDTYYISKLPASSKPIKQKLLELQGKWITLPSNPLPIYSESDK